MNRSIALLSLFVLLLMITSASAQSEPADLDRLSEAIHQTVKEEMPQWMCRRGEPIKGSGNVLVESCFSGDTVIKLSVIPHPSRELASLRFREGAGLNRTKEVVNDLGDEGYAWGFQKSKFAFRKGRYSIFVSISDEEKGADKISRQFAKTVAKGLKDL